MKHILNKILSVAFVLLIAVGIFVGMSLPADAAVAITHRIVANGTQFEVWTGASGGTSPGSFAALKGAADWIAANEVSPVIQFGDGVTPLSVPTTTDWITVANVLPAATYTGKVVSSGDNQYLFVVKDGVQVTFVDIEIQSNSQYSGAKAIYIYGAGSKLIIDGTSTRMESTALTIYNHSGTVDIKAGLITTVTNTSATAINNLASGTINISGGTIRAEQHSVFNRGQTNITGGTVEATGNGKAIYNSISGIANISGGNVIAQDSSALYQSGSTASINISGTAAITSGSTTIDNYEGTTNITGGTVQSTSADDTLIMHGKGTINVNTTGRVVSKSKQIIEFRKYNADDTSKVVIYGVTVWNNKWVAIRICGALNGSGDYEISNVSNYTVDKASVNAPIDSYLNYIFDKWGTTNLRDVAVIGSAQEMTIGINTDFHLSLTPKVPTLSAGQYTKQGGTITLGSSINTNDVQIKISKDGSTFTDFGYTGGTTVTLPNPLAAGTYRIYIFQTIYGTQSEGSESFTVDNTAPTVTDAKISINGDTGTGGAYKIGDTVTATWDSTAEGDNNSDLSSVTVDFSAFGGGTAVSAVYSSGTWTAEYPITSGAIDGTNINVSLTATDNAGNTTTTADTTNATVDNIAPQVTGVAEGTRYNTDKTITFDEGTALLNGSSFNSGDTVASDGDYVLDVTDEVGNITTVNFVIDKTAPTVTLSDNETDNEVKQNDTVTITAAFNEEMSNAPTITITNGGVADEAMTDSGNGMTWTYEWVVPAGDTAAEVTLTGTDLASNPYAGGDSLTFTIDNTQPTITDANISINGATGIGGAYKTGDTVTAIWNNTVGGDNNSDINDVTIDFSAFGGGAAISAVNSSDTWTAVYTITAGAIEGTNINVSVTAADNAGNKATTADSTNAALDNLMPTVSLTDDDADNLVRQNDTVTIRAVFSEEMSSPTISITNGEVVGAPMTDSGDGITWTYDWTVPAGDTVAEVTVTGTDLASNPYAGGDSLSFTIDNTAPIVSGVTQGSSYNIDKTITFDGGTAELNGSLFNSGDTVSTEGTYELSVTDGLGNSTTINFTIDKTEPEITVDVTSDGKPYDGSYTYEDVALTFTATDNTVTDICYSNDGGATWQDYSDPILFTSPGTYEIKGKAVDAAGNESAVVTKAINISRRSSGSSTRENQTPNIEILVNGKVEGNSAIVAVNEVEGRTVTTITIDEQKLKDKLETEGRGAVITLPVKNDSETVVGELNGQMVKNMEIVEAAIEVETTDATYTLPAEQIDVDSISKELGEGVALKDIKIKLEIKKATEEMKEVVQKKADMEGYQLVAQPIDFEISGEKDGRRVKVERFKSFVKRRVALPKGTNPEKISTGVYVNKDGAITHVPTKVTVIDGKYYAEINSLTNSTYSVIWNPKQFSDMEGHWAKDQVNEMGSRLVISGVGKGTYEPDRNITRAEFAAIIVRALGLHEGNKGTDFSDVNASDWFAESVAIASEYGLLTGYDDETFRPNHVITREQAMVIAAKAIKIAGTKVVEGDILAFSDSDKVGSWSSKSVKECIGSGIITGYDEKLNPKGEITRAETATIIMRILETANLI